MQSMVGWHCWAGRVRTKPPLIAPPLPDSDSHRVPDVKVEVWGLGGKEMINPSGWILTLVYILPHSPGHTRGLISPVFTCCPET